MKLSIIIPTFNSGAVINRALDSIVSQTFSDWEVLIMDGVSTDNTIEVAQSYNDPRIRIYSESDKGIYDAMNKGIKKAQGEWVYFLGSDDWLLNNGVLEQVLSSDIDNLDVVYGEVRSPVLTEDNRGGWTKKNVSANRCHQAIFYKNYIFNKLGLYNLRYPYAADFEFNLRWLFNKKIKNTYLPIEIAFFSPEGVSSNNSDENFWKDFYLIVLRKGYWQLKTSEKIYYVKNAILQKQKYYKRIILIIFLQLLKWKLYIRNRIKQTFHGTTSC